MQVKKLYNFPEHRFSVEAKSLKEANDKLKRHLKEVKKHGTD